MTLLTKAGQDTLDRAALDLLVDTYLDCDLYLGLHSGTPDADNEAHRVRYTLEPGGLLRRDRLVEKVTGYERPRLTWDRLELHPTRLVARQARIWTPQGTYDHIGLWTRPEGGALLDVVRLGPYTAGPEGFLMYVNVTVGPATRP